MSDRTVVITGAGSPRGIGRAAASRMARDGWNVALLDLDGDLAEKGAAQARDQHDVKALGLAVDVTDEASVDAAISTVESSLPPIRALFNIAGISSPTPFLQLELPEWEKVLKVNATGTFIVTRRVASQLVEAGQGAIVNMSSVSAEQGGGVFGKVPYSAAKAAILGLTRALARELAPSGVRVNAVAPGIIDTDIRSGLTTPEREAELAAGVPLGRQGTADEVASLFAFLASDDASYLTGVTYDINGGSLIH